MLADILSGTIPARIQLWAIAGSVLLLAAIINLIRKEKLKEGYSIIWFLVGIAMVTFSALAGLLDIFANSLGIAYSPAALFLILTGGLIVLSVHFSVLVSKHDRRYRELAQELALLRAEVMDGRKHTTKIRPAMSAAVLEKAVHEKIGTP